MRDFIQKNVTPYEGDEGFLEGATARTETLWGNVKTLLDAERDRGGVLDVECSWSRAEATSIGCLDNDAAARAPVRPSG